MAHQDDRTEPPLELEQSQLQAAPAAQPYRDDRALEESSLVVHAGELAYAQTAAAAIAGDQDAVRQLWHEHRRWVAAILLAHKPRWADLDDLLQEVALSVVRKIGELRDPAAVRPWLRTVALNAAHLAARTGRRRARPLSLPEEEGRRAAGPGVATARPDDRAPGDEGRRLMDLALRLPDGYREPLLLKAVQNLSYREIGRILGLPETTVETRIARGRKQLRELALAEEPRVGEAVRR